MLQVRLELTTSASLRKASTAYKYGALTDCATGARRRFGFLKWYYFRLNQNASDAMAFVWYIFLFTFLSIRYHRKEPFSIVLIVFSVK